MKKSYFKYYVLPMCLIVFLTLGPGCSDVSTDINNDYDTETESTGDADTDSDTDTDTDTDSDTDTSFDSDSDSDQVFRLNCVEALEGNYGGCSKPE